MVRVSLPKTRQNRILFTLACAAGVVSCSGLLWACAAKPGGNAESVSNTSKPKVVSATPATPVPAQSALESRFQTTIHPFLDTYCATCHSGAEPKAGLDITAYTSEDSVAQDSEKLALFVSKLRNGDMPPATAAKRPSAEARQDAVAWFQGVSRLEAQRHAGDPGTVLAHRLSNSEYNYTIRDLTGVDIQPAKEFPVDPANQAGFDNSGESLNMEPELLKKYMEAAHFVSEHLVLKTDGIDFAPFPVSAVTDRDKYSVNRILAFYEKQPTDLSTYFLAAWRYENRVALGRPTATLSDFGAELKVSAKYLPKVQATLADKTENTGPIAALQILWHKLPLPNGKSPDAASDGCANLAKFVADLRSKVRPAFPNLTMPNMQSGSQPFVMWKDRQYEQTRMTYADGAAFQPDLAALAPDPAAAELLASPQDPAAREKLEAAYKRFCAVFPDVFYVSERARVYLDAASEAAADRVGRLLSAGLHSQTGYFRDDAPLYQLILEKDQQKELDTLWNDFDFVTDAPVRQFQSMIWFERSDSTFFKDPRFNFVRAEDHDISAEPKFEQIKTITLERARTTARGDNVVKAVEDYLNDMGSRFRKMDQERVDSEPIHLAAIQDFAQRAYRRPLTKAEKDDIITFYHTLRTEDQLDHEDAIRDSLVSILMSPYFCYRFAAPAPGNGSQPLADTELASRLSYFLWSSLPDKELLDHAAAGDLHKPEVLKAQTHRLMQDDRIIALATEFGGNWLDFRRFEEHNGVDRDHFKTFDNDLREAMFQEPIRFFTDVVRNDHSVLDFLFGDYTFVNPALAKHYGMPAINGPADEWVRVDNAHLYQRGGLLPMAVFLTKNAPGLRTSPVKRGYWVVRRLLGEEIPPPPPNVPALPSDESKLGDLTLPQMLAKHREDPSCATCHVHFDAVGLSFEGYGPIGELRTLDLGGKPVENQATFRDGSQGTGLEGLRNYVRTQRQDDFLDNLCRKLLADALGRSLILSDDPLIEQMISNLKSNGYRFDGLIETIVTSPQFLNKRSQGSLAQKGD